MKDGYLYTSLRKYAKPHCADGNFVHIAGDDVAHDAIEFNKNTIVIGVLGKYDVHPGFY